MFEGYRLSVMVLTVPGLRVRYSMIPGLEAFYIGQFVNETQAT